MLPHLILTDGDGIDTFDYILHCNLRYLAFIYLQQEVLCEHPLETELLSCENITQDSSDD